MPLEHKIKILKYIAIVVLILTIIVLSTNRIDLKLKKKSCLDIYSSIYQVWSLLECLHKLESMA